MKTIVCSHGFGVRADDRGLFTDIAAAMPEYRFITFDYNTVDESGSLTVRALNEQAAILTEHINKANSKVTVLCHSQGCIIASVADLRNVDRVIFLAPPMTGSIEHFLSRMVSRRGAVYNPAGVSSLPRSDGSTTYVGKGYMESLQAIDIRNKYSSLAAEHELVIIKAKEDAVIGQTNFDFLNVPVIELDGGHDFSPPYRAQLISELKKYI